MLGTWRNRRVSLCAVTVPTSDFVMFVTLRACWGMGQSGQGFECLVSRCSVWEGLGGVAFPEEVCRRTQVGREGSQASASSVLLCASSFPIRVSSAAAPLPCRPARPVLPTTPSSHNQARDTKLVPVKCLPLGTALVMVSPHSRTVAETCLLPSCLGGGL